MRFGALPGSRANALAETSDTFARHLTKLLDVARQLEIVN